MVVACGPCALNKRRLYSSCAYASTDATIRVPTQTPSAPLTSASATSLPVAIPPEASTIIGFTARITCRSSGIVRTTLLLCPPAWRPCATMASTPVRAASSACSTLAACIHTRHPTACNRSTQWTGGTFEWKITSFTRSLAQISTCSSVVAGPNAVLSCKRSTPNKCGVPAAIMRISCCVLGGGSIALPSTPMPLALETAVTSGGYATNPMPAQTKG